MSAKRITERVPSAKVVGTGRINKHQLKFHKIGKNDKSGKCDIHEDGEVASEVIGVIFDINGHGKNILDRKEGLGHGYEQKDVEVVTSNGDVIKAFTYYATSIDENLKPYSWYKEHVVRGAKENKLPEGYIRAIEATMAVEDPDKERHKKELQIYR